MASVVAPVQTRLTADATMAVEDASPGAGQKGGPLAGSAAAPATAKGGAANGKPSKPSFLDKLRKTSSKEKKAAK